MDDMNPMESEVDLENHRHEDEFSPNFDPSEPFVETNGAAGPGKTLMLSATDKLLILLDYSISLKERLERTEGRRQVEDKGISQEISSELSHIKDSNGGRRLDVRCECGHNRFWHMPDGKCMCVYKDKTSNGITLHGDAGLCKCVEYLPAPDRRSK